MIDWVKDLEEKTKAALGKCECRPPWNYYCSRCKARLGMDSYETILKLIGVVRRLDEALKTWED